MEYYKRNYSLYFYKQVKLWVMKQMQMYTYKSSKNKTSLHYSQRINDIHILKSFFGNGSMVLEHQWL